ncbi:MAG TPA: sulfotransferase, partial [Gemmatimonadales bacterium]|nr:sulfotransferase [Gemmatimonadales bacterium]
MKKLFIIGCPRSGTTWTMMLLARHPAVVGCMQVGIVHVLEEFRRWWAIGEKREELRYMNSVVVFPGDGAQGKPAFAGLFDEAGFYDYCRAVADELYTRALVHKPGASIITDKTPENIRSASFLNRVYPDAAYLHVIRDPRSVVSSLRHGAEDFGGKWPRNALDGACYWRDDLLRGRAFADATGPYREVRYEVMLQHGVAELSGLLQWLDLPADPAWVAAAVEASSMKEMKAV